MIQSIVICPDLELAKGLTETLVATGRVRIIRSLDHYPTTVELVRFLRAHAPHVVFLSFESIPPAQACIKLLETESRNLQIIAIHRSSDPVVLQAAMRAGVREFLAAPYELNAVVESLRNVQELLDLKPVTSPTTNNIFSFLPSKAGAGCSTIALNVSSALARRIDMPVLLADFDLNSGMIRFLLKLKNEHSVVDTIERSDDVDENLWPQLVTALGRLDVLHAGPLKPNFRIEPGQIRSVIDFMRRHYLALFFDLSGNLEKYSIEIMQESRRIFMTCTPEIPSLHLAREKLQFLKTLDLDHRVSIILNRASKRALLNAKKVEEILEFPVAKVLPNDYHGVDEATAAGTFVSSSSELGKALTQLADELMLERTAVADIGKHKFLEFISQPSLAR
jgi:pilus assembly protein CpaE